MSYSKELYEKDVPVRVAVTILDLNYGKIFHRDHIIPDIERIEKKVSDVKNRGESTKGMNRDQNKKIFMKH